MKLLIKKRERGNVKMSELITLKKLQHAKQRADLIEQVRTIPERYAGDIRLFAGYCTETRQKEDGEALLNYLAYSIEAQKVKKSTFERRYAAVKKHLEITHGLDMTPDQQETLSQLRAVFQLEAYKDQTRREGQPPAIKSEVMEMVRAMAPREKAICLVNLITANRPTEMVRMRIRDFDFTGRSVAVYLKKQNEWHNKRLTQETVKAVRDYIETYKLRPDDYFVGRVSRWGHYESAQITEGGYYKLIRRLLGFAPYTLRKTQVSAMHEAGADAHTIAQQTGHQSIKTLTDHYLTVSNTTVDKYL